MKRLERLMATALALVARRRLRASDLASDFGVSERTVYRDVAALIAAGFPIQGNAGEGYRLALDAMLRPLALTEAEAEALVLAARHLGFGADEAMRARLGSATAKLESVLDGDARRRVRLHHQSVVLSPFDEPDRGPLGAVLDALRRRDVLHVRYLGVASGEATERAIEPLGVVLSGDALLLIAFCRMRGDARVFRVDRIRSVTATGETFAPRDGLSFSDVLAKERAKRAAHLGS